MTQILVEPALYVFIHQAVARRWSLARILVISMSCAIMLGATSGNFHAIPSPTSRSRDGGSHNTVEQAGGLYQPLQAYHSTAVLASLPLATLRESMQQQSIVNGFPFPRSSEQTESAEMHLPQVVRLSTTRSAMRTVPWRDLTIRNRHSL